MGDPRDVRNVERRPRRVWRDLRRAEKSACGFEGAILRVGERECCERRKLVRKV